MPLTTQGLIEELARFRSDKFALVALVGSMGKDGPEDALARLREIRATASEQMLAVRRKHKGDRTRDEQLQEPVWRDLADLIDEIEPWLAGVVERG